MPATIRRVLIALALALSLSGCATTTLPPEQPPMHTVDEIKDERVNIYEDPWEGFNHNLYNFNYYFDKYFFLPVVSGYEFVTPNIVQTGVSNFFANIVELRNFTNSVFQLNGTKSATTLGRFLTNSTIGIGGLFDVATPMGLTPYKEDFGQTLGYWGSGAGPYLVLPILGPSNVRDTTGFLVDAGIRYGVSLAIDLPHHMDKDTANAIEIGLQTLEAIDKRHNEKFRYFGSQYPFEYDMIRFFYNKKRDFEIMN